MTEGYVPGGLVTCEGGANGMKSRARGLEFGKSHAEIYS